MTAFRGLDFDSSLSWTQNETYGDSVLLERGKFLYDEHWSSGTGAGQLNKAYFKVGNIPSGENHQFDLFSLDRNLFGETLTTNFSGDKIKLFYIENTSTGLGQDLFFCATGEGSTTYLFSYSYLGVILKPEQFTVFGDKRNGFLCYTGERYFYLRDISGNTNGVNYEVGIFGVAM